MNINTIDLNLMIAFDALISHRHVTKAGVAIGRSQPAMSNALSRLRELFEDQLLVKSGSKMVPTPKALQLHQHIHQTLSQFESALNGDVEFHPSKTKRTFTIAMVEHAAFVLMPLLNQYISQEAPDVDISVISVANVPGVQLLESEQCEMAIGLLPMVLPPHIQSSILYREKFISVMRAGHPILKGDFTLEEYLSYRHIAVHPSQESGSQIDDALAKIGKQRRVAVEISHVLLVNLMLADSDLIASLPERNARFFAPQRNLALREMPFKMPAFKTHLSWHQRFEDDPGHKWLRETIGDIAKKC